MHTGTRSLVDLESLGALFTNRVAKAAELIHIGLSSNTVYARCRPGGPWQRLLPGILLLTNAPPTRRQLVSAALTYAGDGAVLTGHDAIQLLGLRSADPSGPVHILIPDSRQVRSDVAVRIERTKRMPKPLQRKGFFVAPCARAVLDTARRLTSLDEARALISEAVQRGMTTPEQLHDELRNGSNRGSALPRKVLVEISDGVRSAAEAWARRLVAKSGLPQPRWNVPVRAGDGTLLGIVDAWWDSVGMAWEIDSYQFHSAPEAYAETVRRGSALTAAGLVVVHTLPARIRKEPRAVVNELRDTYAQALTRRRPPVTADL
ncbi:MAG: hypothetical protein ACRDQ5_03670 [Sciscionella sp.]